MKQTINLFSTAILFVAFSFGALAQSPNVKFGKVSKDELRMKVYSPDSGAHAVVLYEEGYFYETLKHHVRIKVLDKNGLKYANITIPVKEDGDNFQQLKGYTYNIEDGKIVKTKLDRKSCYYVEEAPGRWVAKFAMPDVKAGSVFEYQYVKTPEWHEIPSWYFQHEDIPVKYNELYASIPDILEFKMPQRGYELVLTSPKKTETIGSLHYNTYKWVARGMPAFKREPYMTTARNFLTSVHFELTAVDPLTRPGFDLSSTWEEVNDELLKASYFGLSLESPNNYLNEDVKRLTDGLTDEHQKVRVIYDHVRTHMALDGYLGFTVEGLRNDYNTRKGSVGDINMILLLMLHKAGIKAQPILLSTREHGMLPFVPTLFGFNYMIVGALVGEKEYLLDATDRNCPLGLLPVRCLNGSGRIIAKGYGGLVQIDPGATHKTLDYYDLTFKPEDASLSGKYLQKYEEYAAYNFRDSVFNEKTQEEYIEKEEENCQGLDIISSKFEGHDDIYSICKNDYEIDIQGQVEQAGNVFYIYPMLYKQLKENPFKLAKRMYPVDYAYPYQTTVMCKMTLPEGYVVEEKPESVSFGMTDQVADYAYSVAAMDSFVQITSRMRINKAVFAYNEYEELKLFYDMIIKKHAEPVVIKKAAKK